MYPCIDIRKFNKLEKLRNKLYSGFVLYSDEKLDLIFGHKILLNLDLPNGGYPGS